MSVNNLRTPEDGVTLDTRDPIGTEKVKAAIARVKTGAPPVEAELEAYRQRITTAKTAKLEDAHCSDCAQAWANGRDATIKAIEG